VDDQMRFHGEYFVLMGDVVVFTAVYEHGKKV
jgi:hypothetical protein